MSQPETYGTVKLSRLKNTIARIEEHYAESPERIEDIEITFEFIIGSFFPEVLNNIRRAIMDEHTKGFIEGNNARISLEGKLICMQGLQQDVIKIYDKLNECKKIISDSGYGLDDAPYHGWDAEALGEQRLIQNTIEKEIIALTGMCQEVLRYGDN